MRLLIDYLERAVQLEALLADERNPEFRAQLLSQANAYRKLASKHARQHGLPPPSPPELHARDGFLSRR
jgi:hypothetical protein